MADRRHYLVIGAAGAVGRETVEALRAAGNRVSATVHSTTANFAARLRPDGETLKLDMSNSEGVRSILDTFCSSQDRLDGVAVCSGIAEAGPLELAPLQTVRRAFEINCLSVLAVYQSAMPRLRESRGVLAIVGSISGIMAVPFLGAYSSSKFALEGMTDIMRREAFPWGVHIGIVEPGTINTPMTVNQLADTRADLERLSEEQRELYGGMFDSFVERVETRLPGALEPAEVASAVIEVLTQRSARIAVGDAARESAKFARSGDDLAIDDQFRAAFGGSLGQPASG